MVFSQLEEAVLLLHPRQGSFSRTPLVKLTTTGSPSCMFSNFRRHIHFQSSVTLRTFNFPKCLSSHHVLILPLKKSANSPAYRAKEKDSLNSKIFLLPGEANDHYSLLLPLIIYNFLFLS